MRISLLQQFGPKWRSQLPGDLLKKVREAQKEEARPQFGHARLGPLYYLTLGELLPLLQQKAGRLTASSFGGDSFVKQLENILEPRNAICHARGVSLSGAKAIEALYLQMETSLTVGGLVTLVSKPDVGLLQEKAVQDLIAWIDTVRTAMLELQTLIPIAEIYQLAKEQYWWGAVELAGFDCTLIDQVGSLINDYNSLPVGIGSALLRQRFCGEKRPIQVIDKALLALKGVAR